MKHTTKFTGASTSIRSATRDGNRALEILCLLVGLALTAATLLAADGATTKRTTIVQGPSLEIVQQRAQRLSGINGISRRGLIVAATCGHEEQYGQHGRSDWVHRLPPE